MASHSSDIKKLILVVYYAVPLFVFVLLYALLIERDAIFNISFLVLLAIAFIMLLLLNRKRFLTNVSVSGAEVNVTYLTVFLRSKTITIPFGQLQAYERKGTDFKSFQSCSLKIRRDDKWNEFIILSNKLLKDVPAKINVG